MSFGVALTVKKCGVNICNNMPLKFKQHFTLFLLFFTYMSFFMLIFTLCMCLVAVGKIYWSYNISIFEEVGAFNIAYLPCIVWIVVSIVCLLYCIIPLKKSGLLKT